MFNNFITIFSDYQLTKRILCQYFISILITNHRDDWGERKTSIVTSIVIGLGDLSSALSDGKITKDELDRIIDEIEAMIKLFNA